jgi:TatD DNase family protein
MILTDTHTHLYYERDQIALEQLMQRALNEGVGRFFLPNVDVESIPLVMNLAKLYPENCFPMLGLHPCDVKENYEHELKQIYQEIAQQKIYAIGEIGIDLYWDKTSLDRQISAFKAQINWAKELDLPIVIHCRDAFEQVHEVLKEMQHEGLRGIFHCFTGSLEQARQIIELGFYLGIGGVVTYKNAGLDGVVAQIPLEHLVLETDSPYLAPVPYRGKPNESSYLVPIAQKVADLHQVSLATIAEITTRNSQKIFGI